MVYTPTTPQANAPRSEEKGSYRLNLDATFAVALEHARRMTTMFGTNNSETAIAWEVVEELQSARRSVSSHTTTPRTSFIRYCEENPDAPEARIYDS
jgi:hypothetical protein